MRTYFTHWSDDSDDYDEVTMISCHTSFFVFEHLSLLHQSKEVNTCECFDNDFNFLVNSLINASVINFNILKQLGSQSITWA